MAVIVKEKKKSKRPTIIAPITLVAAKVIPRSTTENKIVPKIPAKTVDTAAQQPPRAVKRLAAR